MEEENHTASSRRLSSTTAFALPSLRYVPLRLFQHCRRWRRGQGPRKVVIREARTDLQYSRKRNGKHQIFLPAAPKGGENQEKSRADSAACVARCRARTSLRRTPREELQIVFAKYDSNGDGKISSSELAAVLESLGGRRRDGDGFISINEFVELNTANVRPTDALEDLRDAFSVFDLDRDGSISADELARVLGKLGESASVAQCRRMIDGVDRDGDGLISFDEFKIMMTSGSYHIIQLKF
ncbi:unnamed protein product [Spirodela intermedia]|uniref:EF-hand domain-containing protein n=1 Tax=Spirodela intermedia TaxID=51605 RepID=A0A7I8I8W0_SPIIN|nr:unnamed protein product [Spirodela intermedia]CAA6654107.1 unnamed protein product [Spirodela intermedia]